MNAAIPPRPIAKLCVVFLIGCTAGCTSRTQASDTLQADTSAWPASFEFGRAATAEEIAAWDIDASPSGEGLPPGEGTVAAGKSIYATKCSACHGATGSEGPFDRLVDKHERDTSKRAAGKTIGSYWPYATTVYDYIHRAMPLSAPGSLTPDEVYSLTAFLLYANGLIDSTQTINATTLPRIAMPAQTRFVPDDRTDGPVIR